MVYWDFEGDIKAYKLVQFHMHAPSEHTYDGVHYDLEFHFVHQDYEDGTLSVVSVPFDVKKGGSSPNTFISDFQFGANNSITLQNLQLSGLFSNLDQTLLYNY